MIKNHIMQNTEDSMKRTWAILGVLLLLVTAPFVQGAPNVLTLERSIDIAMENNPGYQTAEKELAKAKAGVWEAYSRVLPELSANASLQHSWALQESTVPNFLKQAFPPTFPGYEDMPDFIRIAFGMENTWQYGATLNQPLFLGGAGIAGIRIASAGARASRMNLQSRRQNLIYNTTDAFYSCILSKEVVKVQQDALEQARANLEVVTKKYEAGTASKFDKMRAEVNLANKRPEAISAKNRLQMALTNLRVIVGLPKDEEIEVDGTLLYVKDVFAEASLDELQQMALNHRPEVEALKERKYIQKKNITIAKSSFLPKLFFQTNYSFLANTNELDISQDDFSKGFTSSISLQIPLFQGLKNSKQYQKAKLDYRIALDNEESLENGVTAEVELAYNNFQESMEKYQSANQSVDLAQESFDLANLRYEEGASTQLDVWAAQLALTQARLNYLSSLYEYQMARYRLRKVTGQLNGLL